MQPEIYLDGAYGPSNIGDDVLMLVVTRLAAAAVGEANLLVGAHHPELAAQWLPQIAWTDRAQRHRLRPTTWLFGGGGLFYSFPGPSAGGQTSSPAAARLQRLLRSPQMVRRALFARLYLRHGIPNSVRRLGAFAVGVGPFAAGSLAAERTRALLTACEYISVRDAESLAQCTAWNLPRVTLRTDAAFCTPYWIDERTLAAAKPAPRHAVAVIVRDWPHSALGQSYLQPLIDTARRLAQDGVAIVFVALSQDHDQAAIAQLRALTAIGELVVWDPRTDRPDRFIARLAQRVSLVISARAHGVILPAICGVPAICVEVEPKLRNVHRMLPNGTRLWSPPFAVDELYTLATSMLAGHSALSLALHNDVAANQRVAQRAAGEFQAWLAGTNR